MPSDKSKNAEILEKGSFVVVGFTATGSGQASVDLENGCEKRCRTLPL